MRADRDEHGVETALAALGVKIHDHVVARETHTQRSDPLELPTKHVAGHPVGRDAVAHAQNPDFYFQAREAVNPFYARVPDVVQESMDKLGDRADRHYRLVEYSGHPEAERVRVVMGSGGETVRETVAFLQARGERVGVAQVRLYRPFPARALAQAL